MNIQTFATKSDAIDQLVVPALGRHAPAHDVAGIAYAILDFDADRQAFVQSVTTDEFWQVVAAHQLMLQVDWTGGDGEFNALWSVGTSRPFGEVTILASGAIEATEDGYVSLANLDAALSLEGYERGEIVARGGDFDTFTVVSV